MLKLTANDSIQNLANKLGSSTVASFSKYFNSLRPSSFNKAFLSQFLNSSMVFLL